MQLMDTFFMSFHVSRVTEAACIDDCATEIDMQWRDHSDWWLGSTSNPVKCLLLFSGHFKLKSVIRFDTAKPVGHAVQECRIS
jgi:hypothetical protein